MPATGQGHYRRAAPRLGCVRTADGSPADPPARTWAAADRPGRLLTDKAYSNRTIRSHLRRWRIKTTIPEKSDQQKARAAKGSAGGRPPKSGTTSYKQRNTAEHAFNKLKAFRAVATRTDKREYVFQGTIDVASIKLWLRHPATQDPPDPT